jgi:hypothetical protein
MRINLEKLEKNYIRVRHVDKKLKILVLHTIKIRHNYKIKNV